VHKGEEQQRPLKKAKLCEDGGDEVDGTPTSRLCLGQDSISSFAAPSCGSAAVVAGAADQQTSPRAEMNTKVPPLTHSADSPVSSEAAQPVAQTESSSILPYRKMPNWIFVGASVLDLKEAHLMTVVALPDPALGDNMATIKWNVRGDTDQYNISDMRMMVTRGRNSQKSTSSSALAEGSPRSSPSPQSSTSPLAPRSPQSDVSASDSIPVEVDGFIACVPCSFHNLLTARKCKVCGSRLKAPKVIAAKKAPKANVTPKSPDTLVVIDSPEESEASVGSAIGEEDVEKASLRTKKKKKTSSTLMENQKKKGRGDASLHTAKKFAEKYASGRQIQMPQAHHIKGVRNPNFHGCGKCRHGPQGCSSCILYDEKFPYVPTDRVLPLGMVLYDFKDVGKFTTPKALPSGRGLTKLKPEAIWSTVRIGKSDIDKGNYGVFAAVDIPATTVLTDATVELVPRNSAYARAHFNEFDFVNVGREKYILLREPELGMKSLTFFINEANHLEDEGQTAHIEWRMKENKFVWVFNCDVRKGEEILVRYDRDFKS